MNHWKEFIIADKLISASLWSLYSFSQMCILERVAWALLGEEATGCASISPVSASYLKREPEHPTIRGAWIWHRLVDGAGCEGVCLFYIWLSFKAHF